MQTTKRAAADLALPVEAAMAAAFLSSNSDGIKMATLIQIYCVHRHFGPCTLMTPLEMITN